MDLCIARTFAASPLSSILTSDSSALVQLVKETKFAMSPKSALAKQEISQGRGVARRKLKMEGSNDIGRQREAGLYA